MEFVKFEDTEKFENKTSNIFEYNLLDKDINICYANIFGRYPLKGFAINENCKELAFVVEGNGRVFVKNKFYDVKQNDVVLIDIGEKFFWEGELKLVLPCSPAWDTNQYKIVED